MYRSTVPPISIQKKILLIALRSLALTLLLLAVYEPLLKIFSSFVERPTVAVLIDNSLSMSLNDASGSREQQLRALLAQKEWNTLAQSSNVQLFAFSSSLQPVSKESLLLRGTTTDITSALQKIKSTSGQKLSAVVLLSDGNYNSGSNPLYEAEKFPAPILAVGIGDSTEQKDILVKNLSVNTIGYMHSIIPVDATLKSSGITSAQVRVELLEDGKKIDEYNVSLTSREQTAEYAVHFSYTPAIDGIKKITARVQSVEGEITEKNNSKSATIKILNNKMRIVLLAGTPSADVSAFMQVLRSDENTDAQLFLQQPNGELATLAQEKNFTRALSGSSCIILCGFPTASTQSSVIQTLRDAVEKNSLPLLFVASRTLDCNKLRTMEPLLPFTVTSSAINEQSVFPSLIAEQQTSLLLSSQEEKFSPAVWEQLPPVYSSLNTFKAKPEAVVLSKTKIQNITLDSPLLLMRNIGTTKSFAILAYGVWRWNLIGGADDATKNFFSHWISTVVRWLATREDEKFFKVEPEKENAAHGEPVRFFGQVYNQNYQPIENADVQIEAFTTKNAERYKTTLVSIGAGRYEGNFELLQEGEYSYKATATHHGTTVGTVQGKFSVSEQSAEFADTKMNKTLLEQIAGASGGKYFDAKNSGALFQQLLSQSRTPTISTSTQEFELWNLPLLLSCIVLLFGIEWFIRKRSGML